MTRLMLMHDSAHDLHMIYAATNNLESEIAKDIPNKEYIIKQFDLLRKRRKSLLDLLDKWYTEDKEKKTLKDHLDQLFLECEHGDAEHRQWLKDKFNDYYNRVENANKD